MNLPLEPETNERTIHSRIMKLNDDKDGREQVRAWGCAPMPIVTRLFMSRDIPAMSIAIVAI